jgi:hypothetical protein
MNAAPLPPIRDLLRRTVALYRRNLRLVVIVTLPIVAFVDVVIGAGLGELTASVHKKLPIADVYIGVAAEAFVTVPLVFASLARAVVRDCDGGEPPLAGTVFLEGLDLFLPAFLVTAVVACVTAAGLSVLIVPGVYIAVSWYFALQAVAVDGRRGFAALATSAAVVRGHWWHSLAVGLCYGIVLLFVSILPQDIFGSLALATNSNALVVLGSIVFDTIALPFVAIGSTLYYLELRRAAGMPELVRGSAGSRPSQPF